MVCGMHLLCIGRLYAMATKKVDIPLIERHWHRSNWKPYHPTGWSGFRWCLVDMVWLEDTGHRAGNRTIRHTGWSGFRWWLVSIDWKDTDIKLETVPSLWMEWLSVMHCRQWGLVFLFLSYIDWLYAMAIKNVDFHWSKDAGIELETVPSDILDGVAFGDAFQVDIGCFFLFFFLHRLALRHGD